MNPAEGAESATSAVEPATVSDTESFEVFFRARHSDLFAALWLVTRDRQEAEEIMQDAFLRVWERWDRVAALEDPSGYLYRTAMNVFRSRARRAAVAVRRTLRPSLPDDGLAAVEERESIVHTLASLSSRQRAAVVLTDVLGFTSEEAGEALGVKASTVRVLAMRARANLKKELGENDA